METTHKLSDYLKIHQPSGIVTDVQSNSIDRAPIDISISRTNSIEFPWENNIGVWPDDIDVFKANVKKHLNLDFDNWNQINKAKLIYKVKTSDNFYYTIVDELSDNIPTSIKSIRLIYNKLNDTYYEPYYLKEVDGKKEYKLFKASNFDNDIKEGFSKIEGIRRVYKPKSNSVINVPENVGNITPLEGFTGGHSSFEVLDHAIDFNENELQLSPKLDYSSPDSVEYITGKQMKNILSEAKASHYDDTNDPIKKIVKKPSQWEKRSFYILKETLQSNGNYNSFLLAKNVQQAEKDSLLRPITDTDGWIVQLREQFFLIKLNSDNEDFNTINAYLKTWDHVIDRISLVLNQEEGATDLKNTIPFSKQYDISLSAIIDRHQEINSLKKLKSNRENLATALGTKIEGLKDFEYEDFTNAIENIEEKYAILTKANADLLREERILEERVKKFGYEIEYVEGVSKIYKNISFLRATQVAYREKYRKRIRIGFFKITYRTGWRTRYKTVKIPVIKKEHVAVVESPWATDLKTLTENGFTTHFLELTDSGYISQTGESLNSIMEDCKLSENIRLSTVLMIPIYDQSPTNGIRKVGYDMIVRPLYNDVPSVIPDISIEETLSYKAAWKGVEISELIESINLAPGESRRINVKQSFESNRSETQSVTSILDVTEKKSSTFSDFFEQTNRDTKERTSTKSWSAKASGSYGGFGGSASGGGSTKETNKSFAQKIKRAANQSAREMKKQSRVEINTKLSESSKLLIDETISSQIQNINEGRSLNLLFYKLDNVYEGGLNLENMKLTYTRPIQLIKGADIRDIRTFDLYAFDEFLDMVTSDLMLLTSYNYTGIMSEIREIEIRFSIIFKILKKIFKEYLYDIPSNLSISYPEKIDANNKSISGKIINYKDVKTPLTELMKSIENQQEKYVEINQMLKKYKIEESWYNAYKPAITSLKSIQVEIEDKAYKLFNSLEFQPVSIGGKHTFSIPSNAAYLDCVIGASSGLEEYSELMRVEELRKQQSQTNLLIAKTKKIHTNPTIQKSFALNDIKIVEIEEKDGKNIIKLDHPIPDGVWYLKSNDDLYLSHINEDRKSLYIHHSIEGITKENTLVIESVSGVYIKS